jgi:hypothetical protein
MRATLFSAVIAAALAVTAWTPSNAQAQIVVYPSINTSPYANANYYTYPAYSYGYTSNYPGYQTWSYGWTNPSSTWNASWYQSYPVYTGYGGYWSGSSYWRGGYRYRGSPYRW